MSSVKVPALPPLTVTVTAAKVSEVDEFLTVPEMLNIKDMLHVSRNTPEYSNEQVEAYDFAFDEGYLFEQDDY